MHRSSQVTLLTDRHQVSVPRWFAVQAFAAACLTATLRLLEQSSLRVNVAAMDEWWRAATRAGLLAWPQCTAPGPPRAASREPYGATAAVAVPVPQPAGCHTIASPTSSSLSR